MGSKNHIRSITVAAVLATLSTACAAGATTPDDTAFAVESMVDASTDADTAGPAAAEPAVDADPGTDTPPTAGTAGVEGTDGTATSGPIDRWEDVPSGVVQIIGQGDISSFDVSRGVISDNPDAVVTGSGFLIAEDGVLVTNNHVVTGAASVQVQIPGESRTRNARVLGASECWDLAVVQVLDGEDLPWFRWTSTAPPVATEVYAVGYPLGDPEITVTRGIVSKAVVDAQTRWASVDQAIETDADINPGNSGGPLVTANGEVVGVTFAGNAGTRQGFAIGADAASSVIEQLALGRDVDYLGINGVAFTNGEVGGALGAGVPGGIYVQSVETGSDAFDAGVRAGDIIVEVEGTSIAADGTMSEYCDILRSRGADGALTLTLLGRATPVVVERN